LNDQAWEWFKHEEFLKIGSGMFPSSWILILRHLHGLGFGVEIQGTGSCYQRSLGEFLDSLSYLWVVQFLVRKHELC